MTREPVTTNGRQGVLSRDEQACRAAFYAMYLRTVEHLAADEAAALVRLRYPHVWLPEWMRRRTAGGGVS